MTTPVTGLSYYCIIFTVDVRKNKLYCVSYDDYCCSLYVVSSGNVVVSVGAAPHAADVLAAVAAIVLCGWFRWSHCELLSTADGLPEVLPTWTLLSSFWRKR